MSNLKPSFRDLRMAAYITLRDLTEECGISAATISRWERDLMEIKPETAAKIWWAFIHVRVRQYMEWRDLGVHAGAELERLSHE